jgi:hypothetical protein
MRTFILPYIMSEFKDFLESFQDDMTLHVEPLAASGAPSQSSMLESEFRIRIMQRKPLLTHVNAYPIAAEASASVPTSLTESALRPAELKQKMARQYQMIRSLQSFHDLQDVLTSLYPRECSLVGIRMRPFWHHKRSGSAGSLGDCCMPDGYHQFLSQFLRRVVRLSERCFDHAFIREFFMGGGSICVVSSGSLTKSSSK